MDKDFSLDEEIRCGYKVTHETKELWSIQLDLLDKFDKVCKKHNLKYFADSGTLIGAVRHKGFIPWDDDIDISMLRKDYDKLVSIASTEFTEPYFFQCAYTDDGYYRAHSQLRNTNTTAILSYEGNHVNFNQGIFIDIFPLDELEKNPFLRRLKFYYLKLYRKIFTIMFYNDLGQKSLKLYFKQLIRFIFRHRDYKKMFKKYEKCVSKTITKSGNLDKVSYRNKYKKYIDVPMNVYDEVLFVPFENTTIPIPKDYDIPLRLEYGDNYMTPIHANTAHGEVIIDTKVSYKDFLKNN